ncbi:MAG: amidohydrolase [Flavobacteriales bacterium]|nr:putative hydrolase YxeP [Flavobacteriales bacterium]MCC6576672.1 amidohydrolase [Flavobacteriales bacterium]NUQ15207.1 amidohydrolase [Flavobacteriales bacterium]
MIGWRRHLHRHPELSFQETNTVRTVVERLRAEGIEVREGVGRLTPQARGTGAIGLVRGGKGPSKACIALRADLDALPITETGKDAYRSTNPGVMHACGHDAHTAMVLAAGIALHRLRSAWSGTVMLVFQPGEEKEPGGASLLVAEGVFNDPRPSGILGQHVTPELPTGRLGFRSGPFMAAADELYITVQGRGGHAGSPHLCIDPVPVAAQLILALQQVVSRRNRPGQPMVLSLGRVIADGATNIIPDTVRIEGTLRTFDEVWRAELHQLLPALGRGIVEGHGASVDFRIVKGSPVVKNDPDLTARIRAAAVEFVGADNVIDMDIRMGAEDFAYYTHVMPGCFFRLGTGNPAKPGTQSGLHRAEMDIDEDALALGAGMMAWGALRELEEG